MREAVTGSTMAGPGRGPDAAEPGTAPPGRSRWTTPPRPDAAPRDPGRGLDRARRTQRLGGSGRLDATSPLALASHLLDLARDADRTGLTALAEQLLGLACAVLDHPPALFV